MEDKKVDKFDMQTGFYIFRYPKCLIGTIIGLVIFIIGWIILKNS